MTTIEAGTMHFQALCSRVKATAGEAAEIRNCNGQRYIASGMAGADLTIYGTTGNALGAYFESGRIIVMGNAQEATGDTMNDGEIIIHGDSGDATGYAMRGGRILVRGSTGYRAGIHMKAYGDKIPVLVIGGRAGSFLGEYQAGGRIVVLGLHPDGKPPVGAFCGTGMHGGGIFIRGGEPPHGLPPQVSARRAGKADMAEISGDIKAYCEAFGQDPEWLMAQPFVVLRPNMENPYKQLYIHN